MTSTQTILHVPGGSFGKYCPAHDTPISRSWCRYRAPYNAALSLFYKGNCLDADNRIHLNIPLMGRATPLSGGKIPRVMTSDKSVMVRSGPFCAACSQNPFPANHPPTSPMHAHTHTRTHAKSTGADAMTRSQAAAAIAQAVDAAHAAYWVYPNKGT